MKVCELIDILNRCNKNSEIGFCVSVNGGKIIPIIDCFEEKLEDYERKKIFILYGDGSKVE